MAFPYLFSQSRLISASPIFISFHLFTCSHVSHMEGKPQCEGCVIRLQILRKEMIVIRCLSCQIAHYNCLFPTLSLIKTLIIFFLESALAPYDYYFTCSVSLLPSKIRSFVKNADVLITVACAFGSYKYSTSSWELVASASA